MSRARSLFAALTLLGATAASGQKLVSFPTDDGGTVSADLYGDGHASGIVLAHGARYDKSSWAELAKRWAQAGHTVLAIDFRGYGDSKAGSATTATDDGRRYDVLAAVHWMTKRGTSRLAVIGGSMGGAAVAEAATMGEAFGNVHVVLLAPAPIERPEAIRALTLWAVCQDDRGADGKPRLAAIRKQYDRATGWKDLVVLDCAEHAQAIFGGPARDALIARIESFIRGPMP